MDDLDDDKGKPDCFNGEYHDWTHVEAWLGQPAYNYCAVCGHREMNDPGITITIDDMPEEVIYEWLYGKPLWPDVIGDDTNG